MLAPVATAPAGLAWAIIAVVFGKVTFGVNQNLCVCGSVCVFSLLTFHKTLGDFSCSDATWGRRKTDGWKLEGGGRLLAGEGMFQKLAARSMFRHADSQQGRLVDARPG